MAQKLSIAQITEFCKSEEVQARIKSYVLELDTQKVLKRYVYCEYLHDFDNGMELIIAEITDTRPRLFSYEWVFDDCINSFTTQMTNYIIETAQGVGVTTKKELTSLVEKMLSPNNFENIYSLHLTLFDRANMWFSRLKSYFENNFCNEFKKIKFDDTSLRMRFEAQITKCMCDLKLAFPRGLNIKPKCTEWVAEHPEDFEKIDFSQLINEISFSHYFKEVFKEFGDLAGKKNPKSSGISEDFMTVRNKEELKRDTERVFKLLILDYVFELEPVLPLKFIHEYVSNILNTMMTSSPILVHILYIQALFNIFQEEESRMLDDLQKYLDDNNIPYEMNGIQHNQHFSEATGFMGHKFLS